MTSLLQLLRVATPAALFFAVGTTAAIAQTTIQRLPPTSAPYMATQPGNPQVAPPYTQSNQVALTPYAAPGSYPQPPDSAYVAPNAAADGSVVPVQATVPAYGTAPSPVVGSGAGGSANMSSMAPLPMETAVVENEYHWYHYPWAWIPRDGWNSSIEFGLNGAEGNTNSLSYAAGADISRKNDIYNLTVNLDYRRSQSNGLETQNNARANADLDRAIGETALSTFIKGGLEYDTFKAFDSRVNMNGGLSYFWTDTDRLTFITRVGAGASKEVGAADDDWKPEALFGVDAKSQVNSRNRIFAKVDYFPAFEDFTDYRVITDAGWEILLDDAENFSLKLSATNRYDSTPLGLEPQDIDYAATLLYKF